MRLRAAALLVVLATLPAHAGSTMAKLVSIVDGSRVVVTIRGVETKVQLHGVAIPPADDSRPIFKRLNQESVSFMKEYIKDGWLYLEFPSGKQEPDPEGYVSAFVYRGIDATFLNEKLVAEGFAIVNRKQKNEYTSQLVAAENQAKLSQRGIWGSFANGGGSKVASGAAQGNYLGVPGEGYRSSPSYVTTWIFYYY